MTFSLLYSPTLDTIDGTCQLLDLCESALKYKPAFADSFGFKTMSDIKMRHNVNIRVTDKTCQVRVVRVVKKMQYLPLY